ncbi:MAG: glycosyltransferase [Nitrospirae bacterium]|nr:MAG: glycosyltransferase [Nitrospirota bacterium]
MRIVDAWLSWQAIRLVPWEMKKGEMKILHVVPSFGLGGMEKVLCAVINALPREIEQEILALNGDLSATAWLCHARVTLRDFIRPRGNLPFFRLLFQAIRASCPEVVMTYNWGATDAIWLGRLAGVPYILHSEHGFNADEATATHWKRNLVRHVVYRLASKVIVVSHHLKRMLEAQFHIASDRLVFIPNGLDTNRFVPDDRTRSRIRQHLGIQDEDLVIGFIGRFDPVKNLPLLLHVVEHCVREDSRFKLLVIGDGPERAIIQQALAKPILQGHVMWVGKQDEVLPYLQAMDIFLLTSLREQMPMSMLEAMSVGLPVVATAVGDIPVILSEGEAGVMSALDKAPRHLVAALLDLRDPAKRLRMGQAARALVVSRFSQQLMIQRYYEVFRMIGLSAEQQMWFGACRV